MGDKQVRKWSEIVLEERRKGNVVYLCLDQVMVAPVKEIIKQPADGLLWDLNRDEATALSYMDEEGMIHWVNNFAVALVIRELKSEIEALRGYATHKPGCYENDDLCICGLDALLTKEPE